MNDRSLEQLFHLVGAKVGAEIKLATVRGPSKGKVSKPASLGRKVVKAWHRALYALICENSGHDKELRNQLLAAVTDKKTLAATIASIMVSRFGLDVGMSVVIGSIIVRILVDPAVDEICVTWKSSLDSDELNVV